MNLQQLLRAWIPISIFQLTAFHISAQCDPPAALWLVPPQTSTSLVIKWQTVPGSPQYQLRYWENAFPDDKTIVENCGAPPFTLRGLRKNRPYTLEIRSKCGNNTSIWSMALPGATLNSSGTCINMPTGVSAGAGSNAITVNWSSSGSHTIRYRQGTTGDWLIPAGGMTAMTPPLLISGLSPGSYQVEIKRNCSATAGAYLRSTVTIIGSCGTPLTPLVTPSITSAMVALPALPGVIGYQIQYRSSAGGPWISGGNNIPPSIYFLSPLSPATSYQIQIQANCAGGSSDFSPIANFSTGQETGPCLVRKDAGKNMSSDEVLSVNQHFNRPSPYSFGSMIGVNDGGLIFRSFQFEPGNPITQLTKQLRNFHTMDEDFNANPLSYDLNTKPKQTSPEGTPAFTVRNKTYYTKYRLTHGFTNITGATELLQYAPQSWKEKMYREGDWSFSGPGGIRNSFANYTKTFIDQFAPANGSANQILVANYQVGNELWDYPVKTDYHNLFMGAHDAFISKYGLKSNGGWRMKLVAGAFQAYRDNTCTSILRDFSNCDGDLLRHDFIGDYLQFADCDGLRDLDAIDCHPYSFKPNTTTWTFPEDPESETWQIRNLAAWLMANQNPNNGVLLQAKLWSTEFGFDSYTVGEKTQSAYLLRGLMMHSRFHFEKIYFYNAYDVVRENYAYYDGLYNSSGFWKLGTHPDNDAWTSPLEAHGAKPKPSWFGMLDFKNRFGNHVFHKILVEDADAMVILIAKPDSTDPYLVFWSPRQTNDANVNLDIPISKNINLLPAFSGGYKAASTTAQTFAESATSGQSFEAITDPMCGSLIISTIRRNPAFIRLVQCVACPNITQAGSINLPNPSTGGSPFNPGPITSTAAASGGSGGTIQYQWQQSTDNTHFVDISGATSLSYDPPSLTQTTYFRRATKRSNCNEFLHTAAVVIGVGNLCPVTVSFQRIAHNMSGCNPSGDYYFDIKINQVVMNDQITLTGLPGTGVNIPLSLLNGISMDPNVFQNNLHFVNNSTLQWQVNAANGNAQSLRLYYCWADGYPDPVGLTKAISLCSGQSTSCTAGFNAPEPDVELRDAAALLSGEKELSAIPNPGTDHLTIVYKGTAAPQAVLRMFTATGQCISTEHIPVLASQQQWDLNTRDLASGIYFICLQTGTERKWMIWERVGK